LFGPQGRALIARIPKGAPVSAAAPVSVSAGAGGWTYVWDHRRKPHLHPVATPSGLVLTRVEPPDHPWQRGLWFVVKFVDGDNFWEEGDPAGWGVQRHEAPPRLVDGAVEGELSWIRPDRTTMAIRERRRLRHLALADDAYAIDWDVALQAPRDAVLDRTPFNGMWGGYSGLAFRGRGDWSGTRLLLDDDVPCERVAPRRSPWCDLSGPASVGGPAGGICVLDHPHNPAHPVPFYAASRVPGPGYGEGWANTLYPAFLWDGPLRLAAGDTLRLRYRVVVHDGLWDAERCAAAWAEYADGQ
jgi:Methane oxygenase PmoA